MNRISARASIEGPQEPLGCDRSLDPNCSSLRETCRGEVIVFLGSHFITVGLD